MGHLASFLRSAALASAVAVCSALVAQASGWATADAQSAPTAIGSQTIGASGGTLAVSGQKALGLTTLSLTVPANAFSADTQVTIFLFDASLISGQPAAGCAIVAGYQVSWLPRTASAKPLSLAISDPSVGPTDKAFMYGTTGLAPLAGAQVSGHTLTVQISAVTTVVYEHCAATVAQVPQTPSTRAIPAALPHTGAGGEAEVSWVRDLVAILVTVVLVVSVIQVRSRNGGRSSR